MEERIGKMVRGELNSIERMLQMMLDKLQEKAAVIIQAFLRTAHRKVVPAECWRQIYMQASPPTVLERELRQPPPM